MSQSRRTDYDAIALLYDSQPFRAKEPDPELVAFSRVAAATESLTLLDVACGTGNQLIANRALASNADLFGIDRSHGMLRKARSKAPDIVFVQCDAAAVPFVGETFDYISCQFAFHHFTDKLGVLAETFRLLRPGGRFVLHNMCPEECPDWLYYEYFPEAWSIDGQDFWPAAAIASVLSELDFAAVQIEYKHSRTERNLSEWLRRARRRDICSQLQAISDAAYAAGIERLEREVADPNFPATRPDHYCRVTICGDKPAC
jgi:ubiquinone/menaquinone biosynthesis C-methylase UbiE